MVMLFAIWYHLCNFRNVKYTHGGVILLVTLQAEARKSNTPRWVFSTFLKLYKWYQITQRTIYFELDSFMIRRNVTKLKVTCYI